MWKGGFVFLIKKKACLFGGHTLITFIVWNTNVKVRRPSEWLKVLLIPEPKTEVWGSPWADVYI